MSSNVLIIGGGIAGLTVAHQLLCSDAAMSLLVLEERLYPGGKVVTEVRDGYTFDLGPSQFSRRSPAAAALLAELRLADQVTMADSAARQVHLARGDRVVPVPLSPAGAITSRLLSPWAKLRLLAEPVLAGRPAGEESVRAFAARHFGREFADVVVAAAAMGATASDIADISLDAAFPWIRQFEQAAGRWPARCRVEGGSRGGANRRVPAGFVLAWRPWNPHWEEPRPRSGPAASCPARAPQNHHEPQNGYIITSATKARPLGWEPAPVRGVRVMPSTTASGQ
jgi:protoporphyrinogen oxidase